MASFVNGVKMEEETKVKPEPSSPVGIDDDIEDEDTGELHIPKDLTRKGWIIQIPKDLWKALEALEDNDRIEVGEVKVWQTPLNTQKNPNGQKFRLQVNPNLKGFEQIPKQYDLTHLEQAPKNTFVFTEKNLPGFKPNVQGRARADRPRGQDGREKGGSAFRVDKSRPRGPRIIPKHTALYTIPEVELRCTPRENEEWQRLQALKHGTDEKKDVNLFSEIDSRVLYDQGMGIGNTDQMRDFISTAPPKRRPQENKAIRMPRQQLIEALAEKFQKYKFWALKSLKYELRQPEAWLKEVLSDIAYMPRHGPAANKYGLNREYAALFKVQYVEDDQVKAEDIAKEEVYEDEDEEEMEDVKIEVPL